MLLHIIDDLLLVLFILCFFELLSEVSESLNRLRDSTRKDQDYDDYQQEEEGEASCDANQNEHLSQVDLRGQLIHEAVHDLLLHKKDDAVVYLLVSSGACLRHFLSVGCVSLTVNCDRTDLWIRIDKVAVERIEIS